MKNLFNGKMKALTFSFDDGVTQDRRLIEILDKYGLKATFNINTALLNRRNNIGNPAGGTVPHNKVAIYEVKELYKNHEVAVHTLTHPRLPDIEDDETVLYEVDEDRKNIEFLTGCEVVGMAYPCGGVNNDERVAKLIGENTPIKYARTITSTLSFEPQENLLQFNPTIHWLQWEKMYELAEKFLEMKPDTPQIFYIWGHAYELDFRPEWWEEFDKFCALVSGKEDIFYGTNKEVLL